jgi:hypothetical protein
MNCSEYAILEVNEDALPAGHDWILIDEPFRVTFVYVRGRLTAQVLADGWAAYRKVIRDRTERTTPSIPAPRVYAV